jgi:hypothetical protein
MDTNRFMRMKDSPYAEVNQPLITCRCCGFCSCAQGEWSRNAEGRLVWTAAAEIQPGRGPNLSWCGECGVKFTRIELEWNGPTLVLPPDPDHSRG